LGLGRRPLGAILHSSNEPGELSQWLCHDDSRCLSFAVIYANQMMSHLHMSLEYRLKSGQPKYLKNEVKQEALLAQRGRAMLRVCQ